VVVSTDAAAIIAAANKIGRIGSLPILEHGTRALVQRLPDVWFESEARFRRPEKHNHLSQVFAFNTADEPLGNEILEFMRRGR